MKDTTPSIDSTTLSPSFLLFTNKGSLHFVLHGPEMREAPKSFILGFQISKFYPLRVRTKMSSQFSDIFLLLDTISDAYQNTFTTPMCRYLFLLQSHRLNEIVKDFLFLENGAKERKKAIRSHQSHWKFTEWRNFSLQKAKRSGRNLKRKTLYQGVSFKS